MHLRCKEMAYMAFIVFIQGLTQCFIKTIDFTCGKILLKIQRFSLKESQNGENSPTKGPQVPIEIQGKVSLLGGVWSSMAHRVM